MLLLILNGALLAGGPGTPNPLMNADGTSRIVIPWPDGSVRVTRGEASGVLVSDGAAGRHTRQAHERAVRTYTITLSQATGDEAAALVEAWHVTRGGTVPTRWRHPVDDAAGSTADAPRWMIVSEGLDISRTPGGVLASGTLVLEEVGA